VQVTHGVGVGVPDVVVVVLVTEETEQTAVVELALARQRVCAGCRYMQFSPLGPRDGFRARNAARVGKPLFVAI
jgi:hypothetical protein